MQKVGFAVVSVGELVRKEGVAHLFGELVRACYASKEAALLFADENDIGSEAAYKVLPFGAHPVRHEYRYGMPEGATDRREGYAGVAARRLDYHVSRFQSPRLVGLAYYVDGHAVFDAAGHVEVFGFGIDGPFAAFVEKIDCKKGSISYVS